MRHNKVNKKKLLLSDVSLLLAHFSQAAGPFGVARRHVRARVERLIDSRVSRFRVSLNTATMGPPLCGDRYLGLSPVSGDESRALSSDEGRRRHRRPSSDPFMRHFDFQSNGPLNERSPAEGRPGAVIASAGALSLSPVNISPSMTSHRSHGSTSTSRRIVNVSPSARAIEPGRGPRAPVRGN